MKKLTIALSAWLLIGLPVVLLGGIQPASIGGWLLVGIPAAALLALAIGLPIAALWLGLITAASRKLG